MDKPNSTVAKPMVQSGPPPPPSAAPKLMMVFWMLFGALGGISLAQMLWRVLGLGIGELAVAVPVGAVSGALGGALVGTVSRPTLLVFVMAIFAGSSVAALAGKLAWAATGEIAGGLGGALLGGLVWAMWLRIERRKDHELRAWNP